MTTLSGLTAEEVLFAASFSNSAASFPGAEFVEFAVGASAHASVGRTDTALLQLRSATFGPVLACVTDCPACGEALEFDVDAAALMLPAPAGQPSHLSAFGAEVDFRLPTYEDLAAIAGTPDLRAAEAALLGRLVLAATLHGQPVAPSSLPPEAIEAVDTAMAEADPQAGLELDLACAECGARWPAVFDIAAFFRAELAAEARRLLGEVHVLARAYGWSERDILALHPGRRQAYLDLVLGT